MLYAESFTSFFYSRCRQYIRLFLARVAGKLKLGQSFDMRLYKFNLEDLLVDVVCIYGAMEILLSLWPYSNLLEVMKIR
jgi:hypothetical protein